MKKGPTHNDTIDNRFIKQFLYFIGICATVVFLPFHLGLSLEMIVSIMAVIGVGILFDKIRGSYFKENKNLDMLEFPIKLWFQESVAIGLSKFFDLSFNLLVAITVLDNIQPFINFTSKFFGHIQSRQPGNDLTVIDPEKKKRKKTTSLNVLSNKMIKSMVVHMGVKAGLNSVTPMIIENSICNAFASPGTKTIMICRGLINKLNNTKLIKASIAHEIGHLDRSFTDDIFSKTTPFLSKLLISFGILTVPTLIMDFGVVAIPISLAVLYAFKNICECGIRQCEEERADRKSCQYLGKPESAIKVRMLLSEFEKNQIKINYISKYETSNPNSLEAFANKIIDIVNELKDKTLEGEGLIYGLGLKMTGLATHPSTKHRIACMKDEIRRKKTNQI